MKTQQRMYYRCVIGEIENLPNELTYLQSISGRKRGVWIGFCKGDKLHAEHLIVLKKSTRTYIITSRTDIFKKPSGVTLSKRLFPRSKSEKGHDRKPKLRCPTGKVYMKLEKRLSEILDVEMHPNKIPNEVIGKGTADIYRCKGHRHRSGHKEHLVKIQHGTLGIKINGEELGVLVVTIETD